MAVSKLKAHLSQKHANSSLKNNARSSSGLLGILQIKWMAL
jgi:hypothetical protein